MSPADSTPRRRRPGFWPVLAAVLCALAVAAGIRLGGVHTWSVISGSMNPTIPQGSVVLTVGDTEPIPGHVYLYNHPGFDEPVLHRYLGPAGDGTLIFQGDANPVPDQPVHPEQLTGRMVAFTALPRALGDALNAAAVDRPSALLTAGLTTAGVAALAGAGILAARRRAVHD